MYLGCALLIALVLQGAVCDDEPTEKKVEPAQEVVYNIPKPVGFSHIAEHFDDLDAFKDRWVLSEATKDGAEENVAKYNGKAIRNFAAVSHTFSAWSIAPC